MDISASSIDRHVMLKSWSRPLFVALTAISVAIWWTPLTSSFALALSDEQYTHILLILPISATLIFIGWNPDSSSDWKLAESAKGSRAVLAAGFLVIAGLLNVVVRWRFHLSSDLQMTMTMLALVTWWIAAFRLSFGAHAFRRALFPLFFLLWMVPLPEFALNSVVRLLQHGSAATAHLFFALAGFPVAQRGMLVHIPGLTLAVAPECSSIRSSLMLLVTTMVLAQLLLHSAGRKLLVVAAAIPLSIAKNGLRIFTLGALATRVDPSFLTGRLHRQGGGIFFLIALVAILQLLWILHRGEAQSPKLNSHAALQKKILPANT